MEIAAEECHSEILTLLLKYGAKLGGDTGVYGGALEAAVFKGHETTVQRLLEAGASIQASVLQSAVHSGNIKIMRYLLTSVFKGAKNEGTRAEDEENEVASTAEPIDAQVQLTPTTRLNLALYTASLAGRVSIAKILFEYGADGNARTTGFHCTALAAACAHGHDEMIVLLLEKGADVNQILPEQKKKGSWIPRTSTPPKGRGWILRHEGNESGRHGTALQAAGYAGNVTSVEILLRHGAYPNAAGGYYGTALEAAALGGSLEVVEKLLEYGAEVNTSLGVYGNPLQAAVLGGNAEVIERLIQAGADVKAEGGQWTYPIVAAAQTGNASNLRLLLAANADVNSTSKDIGTALHVAVTTQPLQQSKTPVPPFYRESLTSEFDDFVDFAQRTRGIASMQSPLIFGNILKFAAKEIFLDNDSLPQLGATPSIQGLLECTRVLLEAHADPNVTGGHDGTLLLGAVV